MSAGGADLTLAGVANRVRAGDATRTGSRSIPSLEETSTGVDPNSDVFGRQTGLNIAMTTMTGRAFDALEQIDLANRPSTGGGNLRVNDRSVINASYGETSFVLKQPDTNQDD